ncbi:CsbD family protein [uncultured Corynebacterium sp.]|uniref:CsbD family protein n=1 Tax=uncultured Corynebacterium sp. TaxID=159447 RepID=UPI0025FA242E|nr:CsbD family protein [uncultured Corynebacterium sp.]
MGISDDIKNKADEFGGKAKEAAGDVTDNEDLKAEGKGDQAESKIKQGIEDLKDKASEFLNKDK